MQGPVRRAVTILDEEGPRVLWFKLLGLTVYRRLRLAVRALDEPIQPKTSALPLEFSFLEPHELTTYTGLRGEEEARRAEARLRRGERCWTARLDGAIINVRWVATDHARIDYLDATIPLEPGEAYVYDLYTVSESRGLGVAGEASEQIARVLAAEGYRCMLGAVLPENEIGARMHASHGYRPLGAIRSVRLGPWRRVFVPRRG